MKLELSDADAKTVCNRLVGFLRDYVEEAGIGGVVIGLSGGLDSSVTAHLAVNALGPQRVYDLAMPDTNSSSMDISDARMVAEQLGISCEVVRVGPTVEAYFGSRLFGTPSNENELEKYGLASPEDKLRRGNFSARVRMAVLFDYSKVNNLIVLGTGNKTEWLLGYFTIFGDAACSINLLNGLYKTQVRKIAEYLGVPKKIIDRIPSAGLWPGQTDEEELGVSYEKVDKYLYRFFECGESPVDLVSEGFDLEFQKRVDSLVSESVFKRKIPIFAPVDEK